MQEALRTYARLDEALGEMRQAARPVGRLDGFTARLEELLCQPESSGVPSAAPAPRPEAPSGKEMVRSILRAFEEIQEAKVFGEDED